MQLSKLLPKTRETYINKKVIVEAGLLRGQGVIQSFHNSTTAIIKFDKPVRIQSHLQQRGELRTVSVHIKNIFI